MGKFTEFNLPLKGLSDGEHTFEYRLGKQFFANMENEDVRDADLTVKLTVKVKGAIYDLKFDINGEVITLCDRCLDDLHIPIEADYHIMVEFGDDYNDESDDLLIIPNSDNYLNVAYMIYDTVALAIPIKHVHPMGKCNRQMTAILRKHRSHGNDEDSELENDLIDEMDTMGPSSQDTDPRWDGLKDVNTED